MNRQAKHRFVCTTCGVQYAASTEPPAACAICEDDRQFVGWDGQQWTTLERLRDEYVNRFETMEPNLVRLGMTPSFGIGQHAFVVSSPGGNLLWDCVTLLDDETIERIEALGGLRAIALSHPHYLSTVAEWSAAFGDVPVYVHAADAEWVTVPDARYEFWEGATRSLWDDLTLVHTGGHFPGSCVAHWPSGAEGAGALLAGDSVQVVHDRTRVSFMHSFVNYIPLSSRQVRGVAKALEPLRYDRIYSPWPGRIVQRDAEEVVRRSVRRYLAAIGPGDSERAIRAQVDVPATAGEVWAAWTTEEGARSFFAPACRIEARPDGAYELYFDLEAPPGERGGEGMRVLALDPPRLLSFTWNAPPHLATVRGQRTFVQVVLEPLADDATRVHLLHTGFSRGDEWDEAYAYFERAWADVVLPRLAHAMKNGPYDWERRPEV